MRGLGVVVRTGIAFLLLVLAGAQAFGAAAASDERAMALWARSCALCHIDGNAGAPRVGQAEEWGPRLAQGRETLLKHTVEGLNSMPPLGYCMACERDDFLAMIDFMTAGLEATQPGGAP
jgi:Cytochrome c5